MGENSGARGNNNSVKGNKEKRQSEGSFARWQQSTREQLGTTVHVVLTLAAGSIAYLAGLVLGKDAVHFSIWAAIFTGLGARLLLLSVGAGLWVHWSRLNDFRYTARTARIRNLGKKRGLKPGVAKWPVWLTEDASKGPTWLAEAVEQLKGPPKLNQSSGTGADQKQGMVTGQQQGPEPDTLQRVLEHYRTRSDEYGKCTWRFLTMQFLCSL